MAYIIAILSIIIADLLTKEIVKQKFELGKKYAVRPPLMFYHVKNTGIALNKLSQKPAMVMKIVGSCLIAVFIRFIWLLRQKGAFAEKIATSLLLGGAIANFIDRKKNKSVTDFIYIAKGKLPIFNVADIFVFIGSALFAICNILPSRCKK